MSEETEPLVDVPVWDWPVRLFHWAFAVFFAISWISGQLGDRDLHYVSGMTMLGLVIFRLLWGLVGSRTARFSHFLRGPRSAVTYLRTSFAHRAPSHTHGHNAAGGLMVVALVLLIGLQALSGMSSTDDVFFEGPLYGRLPHWLASPLESMHEPLAIILLIFALVHIAVVLIYWLRKRENLVRAMIVGKARLPRTIAHMAEQRGDTRRAPLWRALICIVIAAAVPAAIHVSLMS